MLSYQINALDGFNNTQELKIKKALELAFRAANSIYFKSKIMDFEHDEVTTTGRLWWKKSTSKKVAGFYFAKGEVFYSNAEIYSKIMSGSELLTPATNETSDLWLVCKSSRWSTSATAFGYPADKTIYIYSWWVNFASISELANTLFHEWTHKVCFEHEFSSSANRESSVPYALGDMIQEIIEENPEWSLVK